MGGVEYFWPGFREIYLRIEGKPQHNQSQEINWTGNRAATILCIACPLTPFSYFISLFFTSHQSLVLVGRLKVYAFLPQHIFTEMRCRYLRNEKKKCVLVCNYTC